MSASEDEQGFRPHPGDPWHPDWGVGDTAEFEDVEVEELVGDETVDDEAAEDEAAEGKPPKKKRGWFRRGKKKKKQQQEPEEGEAEAERDIGEVEVDTEPTAEQAPAAEALVEESTAAAIESDTGEAGPLPDWLSEPAIAPDLPEPDFDALADAFDEVDDDLDEDVIPAPQEVSPDPVDAGHGVASTEVYESLRSAEQEDDTAEWAAFAQGHAVDVTDVESGEEAGHEVAPDRLPAELRVDEGVASVEPTVEEAGEPPRRRRRIFGRRRRDADEQTTPDQLELDTEGDEQPPGVAEGEPASQPAPEEPEPLPEPALPDWASSVGERPIEAEDATPLEAPGEALHTAGGAPDVADLLEEPLPSGDDEGPTSEVIESAVAPEALPPLEVDDPSRVPESWFAEAADDVSSVDEWEGAEGEPEPAAPVGRDEDEAVGPSPPPPPAEEAPDDDQVSWRAADGEPLAPIDFSEEEEPPLDDDDEWVTGPIEVRDADDTEEMEPDELEDWSRTVYRGSVTTEHRGLAEEVARRTDEDDDTELQAISAAMPGLGTCVVGFEDVADLGSEEDVYSEPARSDLGARILTAVVLLGLLFGSLWVGGEALAVFIGLIMMLGLGEFYATLRARGYQPIAFFGLVGGGAALAATWFYGPISIPVAVVATAVLTFFFYAFAPRRRDALTNGGLTVLGVVWITGTAAFAYPILDHPHYKVLIFGVAAATVAMDVGAYFFGRTWGSSPLAPVLSPNKSVEGLAGGVILAIGVAVLIGRTMEPFDIQVGAALGLLVAVLAPIGDLAESMVKRSLGVKDMGSVLPGHGGVLDRVDAFLFVLPAAWVLFVIAGLV